MPSRTPKPPFDTVAVAGVGLIGGSIAAALKLRGLANSVIGIGRSRERLEAARVAGLLDGVATEFDEVESAELVVVCTPVDRIVEDVRRAAALGPGTLITDAGSVKACLCDELHGTLPDGVTFVGSHPLAGSEKSGWENGTADLFVDRLCVITPDDDSKGTTVDRVEEFWQALGMRTQRMSAADHDRAVAATSHVPHVVAAALMSLINDSNAPLASTGFRDVTRIAAGDPHLWTAILKGNSAAVCDELDRLISELSRYRDSLKNVDFEAIGKLLTDAQRRRMSIDQ